MGNGELRKMGVNLVPFPRLHFFLLAQAPLFAPDQGAKVKLSCQELTEQMRSSRNFLANVKSEDGKYLTASCGYRGAELKTQEIDDEVAKIQQKSAQFAKMYKRKAFLHWYKGEGMDEMEFQE